jgi:predicted DNA-binding transcriptional regulator YafY
VGRRSSTESIALIYGAFLRERTWTQAALAREVEIGIPALRKRLDELTTLGMPLERQDDPPHVYWSVPQNWFPGGILFSNEDLPDLLHVLWHTARGRRRANLLRVLLGADRDRADVVATEAAIVTHEASEADETFLPIVEDAIARRMAVKMRFYSTDRRAIETRHVSVHRVDVGPPTRLVATCHKSGSIKWFRVDNIVEARADSETAYRSARDADVERFYADSIDGFREATEAEEHAFFVRDPEATWIERNLLARMRTEPVDDGIRITVKTAGALRVARYVVGLGAAARAETPRLKMLVEELAKGALKSSAEIGKLAKTRGEVAERSLRRANR